APAGDCLRRVLTARATAEDLGHEEDLIAAELRVVEGVGLALLLQLQTVVFERVLAEAGEGDGLEEAGRDDAIGVDVVAAHRDGAPTDRDSFGIHFRSSRLSECRTAPVRR